MTAGLPVPFDPEGGRPAPRGALAEGFEIRRVGAEPRRFHGRAVVPQIEERPLARGFVLEPRRDPVEASRARPGDSRLTAQILGHTEVEALQFFDTRALAQGSEAYRRAGAEPSLRPAPAQVVSLIV